ncbi:hypothetical protein ACFL5A_03845 [Gemmatimonadota bacterium]
MPVIPFHQLPDQARLWVFPSHRTLSQEEEGRLLGAVDAFLEDWAAHGSPLPAGRDWRHGCFLLVAVDESTAPPSGCSIDSLANQLKDLGRELGVELLDHAPVFFRKGEELVRVTRREFRSLVDAGEVTLDTPVFDNSITRLGQLGGDWEKPAGASWHRRAFFRNGVNGSA